MPKYRLFKESEDHADRVVDASYKDHRLVPTIKALLLNDTHGEGSKALEKPEVKQAMVDLEAAIIDCAHKWCDRLIEPTAVILSYQRAEQTPKVDVSSLTAAEKKLYDLSKKMDLLSKHAEKKRSGGLSLKDKQLADLLDKLPSL